MECAGATMPFVTNGLVVFRGVSYLAAAALETFGVVVICGTAAGPLGLRGGTTLFLKTFPSHASDAVRVVGLDSELLPALCKE